MFDSVGCGLQTRVARMVMTTLVDDVNVIINNFITMGERVPLKQRIEDKSNTRV